MSSLLYTKTAHFEPISTHIFPFHVNTIDSLTIGKTFIGDKPWQI